MERAYKFRIYPTREQESLIQRTFGCCRYVFNHFLAERKETYEKTGKSPTFFVQNKGLTVLKHSEETAWLCDPDKHALQNALRDLDTSFQNFFRGVKTGRHVGYPKFKSKRDRHRSYRTNGPFRFEEKAVRLPKLGLVKCRISKKIEGRILSATVSQNPSGKYFVSLCCTDVEIEPLPKTGAKAGVDLGVKVLATTSGADIYPNNKRLSKADKQLRRLARALSRKQKGSRNREKARVRLACLQERIANQRRDDIQQATTDLIRKYDVICLENLKAKGMLQNHRLARSVADASFAEFRRQLEYKAAWHGRTVSVIDTFYPSSQLCSNCGFRNSETKDLKVRKWICPECGAIHDRDVNAAINILNEGLRLLA